MWHFGSESKSPFFFSPVVAADSIARVKKKLGKLSVNFYLLGFMVTEVSATSVERKQSEKKSRQFGNCVIEGYFKSGSWERSVGSKPLGGNHIRSFVSETSLFTTANSLLTKNHSSVLAWWNSVMYEFLIFRFDRRTTLSADGFEIDIEPQLNPSPKVFPSSQSLLDVACFEKESENLCRRFGLSGVRWKTASANRAFAGLCDITFQSFYLPMTDGLMMLSTPMACWWTGYYVKVRADIRGSSFSAKIAAKPDEISLSLCRLACRLQKTVRPFIRYLLQKSVWKQ